MSRLSENELTFLAFRYALGRMSYVVSDVVDHLKEVWGGLEPNYQDLIKKEIDEAIKMGVAGMTMDVQKWREILELKSYGEDDK